MKQYYCMRLRIPSVDDIYCKKVQLVIIILYRDGNGWFTCSYYVDKEGDGNFHRVKDDGITVTCGLHNKKVTYILYDCVSLEYHTAGL